MELAKTDTVSTFVTVVAWIFIVLSGFGAFITTMQNIMISFVPAIEPPANSGFIFQHFRLLFLLPWVASLVGLISAVGLLKRKEWARKTFIGLLSLGVLWCVGSLLVVYFLGLDQPPIPEGASDQYAQTAQQFESFRVGVQIASGIFALSVSGLFIWIINKLMHPSVLDEFAT